MDHLYTRHLIHTLIIMDESPSTCNLDIESDFASSKPKGKAKALALLLVHWGREDDFATITWPIKSLMTMP